MAGVLFKIGLSAVLLLAVLFQVFLKTPVWLAFGIGRVMQPLSDFPYTCRKIVDSRMEACEDMWLSESTRQLFLACSDPNARPHWMPNVANLNMSARSQKDSIVALDIDKPVHGGFEFRTLKTPGFSGTAGDGLLNAVGFTGVDNPDSGRIELLVINNRPSVDAVTGQFADQYASGANGTIDLFETGSDATELKYIRTYAEKLIATPNRVAAVNSKTFYVTNDHGQHKLGIQHHLSPLIKTGDVTFCEADKGCRTTAGGLSFPNGLARDKDGLVYVPSSLLGTVHIYRTLPNNDLEKVEDVSTGFSLDNISVDQHGDIWVAAFPMGLEILKAYNDPYNAHPPSTVLRITKVDGKYVVDKIIEDAAGEVLPGATTVVHDAKTGRLFFSSVISPFIAVCEPKP
ncbi:hypothetical protein FZEAL_9069 [Fusarium zealandicum]|uniref:SMP-30/Gluconolactonase/LRE-like region domain-containing protein n=1 Tax=Fusarium zealandicum TaxID=1053134 RepID=A0A8H4UCX0_9HYPO|nr:hypothetical protein FZEAL_9069 [Fusarium zealandicum]